MRRRHLGNFLIKRTMQLRLTIKFLLITLVLFFISGWVEFITIWPVIEEFVPNAVQGQLLSQLIFKLVMSGIPLLIIFIVTGIMITHRIAGPLHRIEQTLTRFSEGKSVADIHIRRKDELHDLVQKLNMIIAQYTKKKH